MRHRRPRGRARRRAHRRGAGATPSCSRPRSTSCAGQARVELEEISCVAVDLGPGLFTGLRVGVAAAKAMAQALRVPMIGVPSLDLLAFPVRYTSRLIVAAIDARRGEVFYAFYRQVPGGVQRVSDHLARLARRPRVRAAGRPRRDPARRRRRPALPRGLRRPEAGRARRPGPRPPVGGVAGAARPRPGAARAVRRARGSSRRSTCASPTPRSTGRTRDGGARDGRRAGRRSTRRCAVRHRADAAPPPARSVLRIEDAGVPAAVDARAVPVASWPCATAARTSWPRVGGAVVGYGGVMYVLPDAHITTVAVDPACQRQRHRTRLLLGLCRAAVGAGRHRPHPRGAGVATRRPRRSTAASASPRPAPARPTTGRRRARPRTPS